MLTAASHSSTMLFRVFPSTSSSSSTVTTSKLLSVMRNTCRRGGQQQPSSSSSSSTRNLFVASCVRRRCVPKTNNNTITHNSGNRLYYTMRRKVSSNHYHPRVDTPFVSRRLSLLLHRDSAVLSLRIGGGMCLVGYWWMLLAIPQTTLFPKTTTTQCEAMIAPLGPEQQQPSAEEELLLLDANIGKSVQTSSDSLRSKLKRAFRMIRRILKLMAVFTPVAALYPLHWMIQIGSGSNNNTMDGLDAQEVVLNSLEQGKIPEGFQGWYYHRILNAVEWSGAALIKIMQWAGSRPDMFGQDFCAVFSQLQDDTTPHAWKHTEQALIEAYGKNWQDHVELGEILGSGCIAQVYKGSVMDSDGSKRCVAIKIMHPNVEDDIHADLDILRTTVSVMERLNFGPLKDLKWLNLPGFLEEMAAMLTLQLDLRTEGEHLKQFNDNFKGNNTVIFPKLIEEYPPAKHVLVESFCEGVPIMDFIKNNKADRELLTKMCTGAIRAVCQMIFLDNFTHGDLHPGNVLVSDDYKFVFLDAGIVTQHSPSDHRLISDVLAAFIRCDGRKAGKLMIEDSDARIEHSGEHSVDEEGFIKVIESITVKASGRDYLMKHLGTYITQICNSASTHHVMLNQAFISAALAVKIQEGAALALDPSIEIWRIAIPIILEGERRHRTGQAKEILGLESIIEWLSLGQTKEKKAMEERKQKALQQDRHSELHDTSDHQVVASN